MSKLITRQFFLYNTFLNIISNCPMYYWLEEASSFSCRLIYLPRRSIHPDNKCFQLFFLPTISFLHPHLLLCFASSAHELLSSLMSARFCVNVDRELALKFLFDFFKVNKYLLEYSSNSPYISV